MSDLISRETALNALGERSLTWTGGDYELGCRNQYDTDRLAIETVPSAQQWIPCSERMPEEDHWLGGSGRQFSDEVLVSVVNGDDEDIWTYISQTIDGEWALELPRHCKIIAWMPLPEPYKEGEENG